MTLRHELSKACAEEIEGLKQVCLQISHNVLDSLENPNNPRAAFRSTVIFNVIKRAMLSERLPHRLPVYLRYEADISEKWKLAHRPRSWEK